MTKLSILPICVLFCLIAVRPFEAAAQDKEFTQFYATPLTLNPALTGNMEGKYRVASIYRDQWRKVLDNPITTFAVAGDFRFNARKKSVYNDAVGLGLVFVNDRVNVIDFNTTQIAVSLAYHKALDVDERQFLSLGLQGGVTQRSVNYASLNFHDEFDGINGYNLPSLENLPENNFAYPDYNVGLNYSARFGRATAIYAGVALHHFLEPNVSFFNSGQDGDKLKRKISGQFAANLPLGSKVALLPRFLIAQQGSHMQINTGANIRTSVGKYGTGAFHIGGWVRPVRNDDSFGVDAVVALLGFEVNNVLLGLSYDLNFRALSADQRQGAFEISIAYLGEYESEEILCPKF
jgi:type IX secretion system PorP/SprF family membrane protein